MLGGGDDRKPESSPQINAMPPLSTPNSMRPPSPGRARSSSMREGMGRREQSPIRGAIFGEPRAQSALHDRPERRDGPFASPQLPRESPHSFRAFRPEQQEQRIPNNGPGMLGRPSSQPTELIAPRSVEEIIRHRGAPQDVGYGGFRPFGDGLGMRGDMMPRQEVHPFGSGVTSQPRDAEVFGSPQMDRDFRRVAQQPQHGPFGTPLREDQTGLFRPAYQHAPDAARESIEARPMHEMRRDEPRSSPPISEFPPYQRGRNGFIDRPMTFEEHQRLEREQQRKESDGSLHRALLGISPDLNRKGRNSPLPQAVQGAQPKHIGPGGDNPGIKMEFGRMFSGLGSGVGSNTPGNGANTPSRMSPARAFEDGDLIRAATAGIEDGRNGMRGRGGKKSNRRNRDGEKLDGDGRMTPDSQRGNKRAKPNPTAHHHHHHVQPHHHHYHHHDPAETQQGSFNMIRFPSNSGQNPTPQPTHHHHHHHNPHAHPTHHHHHHAPRSSALAPRKPTVTVVSKRLLEEVESKRRDHLGSQLYTTELYQPPLAETPLDAKIKFSSKMKPIPCFEGKENCTYTVRVPRYYLASSQQARANGQPSALEEICKNCHLWGTDVYTDDSDIIAAAVHSGWLKGDYGEHNEALQELCDNESEADGAADDSDEVPLILTEKPSKPIRPPADCPDAHITVLILPPLEAYASTMQHHLQSREWKKTHDGMSFMIHRIEFVDEGTSGRFTERGMAARKQRIALEEAKRREAAAGLLHMFANGHAGGAVSVGA